MCFIVLVGFFCIFVDPASAASLISTQPNARWNENDATLHIKDLYFVPHYLHKKIIKDRDTLGFKGDQGLAQSALVKSALVIGTFPPWLVNIGH